MASKPTAGFSTRAIHAGYDRTGQHGALNPPIYLSSTFAFDSVEQGRSRFAGETRGHVYTRISNPTLALLEQRMASLEAGEAGIAFASGMGAIASMFWTLVRPGDEILADQTLYGCTFALLEHGLREFGVNVRYVPLADLDAVATAINSKTKLIYFETPANPTMGLVDIAAVAQLAKGSGALIAVDNTYCTPYLQRPLTLGADIVVHSATKYISGHGDVTAGILVSSEEIASRIRLQGLKDMTGAVLSPQDAFLLLRGLKTLTIRMDRHCDNTEALANMLSQHPAVSHVHFPGLPDFPQHDLATRQMARYGGMIALELRGGRAAGERFMDALQVFTRAVSLGDCESLAQHPASMTHSTYTPEELAAHGISEGLVRLSVGLEDAADLIADIEQALIKASTTSNPAA